MLVALISSSQKDRQTTGLACFHPPPAFTFICIRMVAASVGPSLGFTEKMDVATTALALQGLKAFAYELLPAGVAGDAWSSRSGPYQSIRPIPVKAGTDRTDRPGPAQPARSQIASSRRNLSRLNRPGQFGPARSGPNDPAGSASASTHTHTR
jgi:hypothetical protein